jgi:hypothetical protein
MRRLFASAILLQKYHASTFSEKRVIFSLIAQSLRLAVLTVPGLDRSGRGPRLLRQRLHEDLSAVID